MAKQQDSYENMMSSIFDVLFAQAKAGKPPKPPKMTGLSGSSDMARALAEIASAPGMYLKDGAFAPFQEAVNNSNLLDFHLDTHDGANEDSSRVRMRPTAELGKYFDNPDKFIANLAKAGKSDRAIGKALLGKGLDFSQSYAWAKFRNGLSAKDAWNVGLSGFDSPGLAGERAAVKMLAETSAIKALRGQGDLAGAKKVADIIRSSKASMTSPKALENLLKKSNVSGANIGLIMGQFAGSSGGVTGKGFKTAAENSAVRLLGSSNKDLVALIKGASVRDLSTPQNLEAFLTEQIKEQQKLKDAGGKYVNISGKEINKLLGDLTGDSHVRSMTGDHAFRGLKGKEYRSIYINNLQYRESVTTDPKEALKLRKARAAIYTWDRLKGGINPKSGKDSSTDFKGVLGEIKRGLDDISGKNDKRSLILRKELEKYQKEIGEVQKTLSDRRDAYNNSGRFSSLVGFTKAKDFRLSVKGYKAELGAKMSNLKLKASKVDKSTPEGKLALKEIRLNILMLKEAEQNMSSNANNWLRRDFAIEMGRWNKALGAFNTEILQGGLLGSFMSGYAFQVGDDYFFSPSKRTNIRMDKILKGGGADMLDKDTPKTLSILIARNDIDQRWAKLNALYYWTPASIAKTIFYNGEGAFYGRYMRQTNILERLMKNDGSLFKELAQLNSLTGFLNKSGGLDEGKILTDWEGFSSIISGLSGSPAFNSFVKKFKNTDKVVKFFGKAGSWGSIIHRRFGFAGLAGKVSKKLAKRLEATFLGKIPGMSGPGGLISRFAGREIGVAQLIAAGLKQAIVAFGTSVGGPLGAFLEALPSFIYETIANKIMVPLMKVASLVFWSLALILLFLFSLITGGLNTITTEHASVLPGPAISCVEANPNADTYPEGYDEVISIGPAPPGSTCPIKIAMPCTQGSGACASSYHKANKSIDTDPGPSTVWYAPSDGKITAYSASNMCGDGKDYGGILWFEDSNGNQYRLIHVKLVGSIGSVKKDAAVAIMWNGIAKDGEGLEQSKCFDNGHFHLDVMQSGSWVNAENWYRDELQCNLSSCYCGN